MVSMALLGGYACLHAEAEGKFFTAAGAGAGACTVTERGVAWWQAASTSWRGATTTDIPLFVGRPDCLTVSGGDGGERRV